MAHGADLGAYQGFRTGVKQVAHSAKSRSQVWFSHACEAGHSVSSKDIRGIRPCMGISRADLPPRAAYRTRGVYAPRCRLVNILGPGEGPKRVWAVRPLKSGTRAGFRTS